MPGDSKNNIIHKNLRVHGNVQGVAYRVSTREKARTLSLAGWVRNEPDGTVRAQVEGPKEKVRAFIGWCKDGSPWADVDNVEVEEGEIEGYDTFIIKRN